MKMIGAFVRAPFIGDARNFVARAIGNVLKAFSILFSLKSVELGQLSTRVNSLTYNAICVRLRVLLHTCSL